MGLKLLRQKNNDKMLNDKIAAIVIRRLRILLAKWIFSNKKSQPNMKFRIEFYIKSYSRNYVLASVYKIVDKLTKHSKW